MYLQPLLALAALSSALPVLESSVSEKSASQLKSRSLQVTTNVADMQRTDSSSKTSSKYLRSTLYGQADLEAPYLGGDYLTNVSFASQTFLLLIDTGSSDTWLPESGFTCVNITTNATVPEADCYFGSSGYTPDSSFMQIPDENFNISYADLEYLNGIIGTDTVTLAGIQVPNQTIGLATIAGWEGDGISSGLVGLAFPILTSAFAGTNYSADNFTTLGDAPGDHEPYSSVINTIFFVDNLTTPEFSMALSRDVSNTSYGGVLAIGGYPDPSAPTINATGEFASTPIDFLYVNPDSPLLLENPDTFTFYTIHPDGLVWESASGVVGGDTNSSRQYVVDSGTTLLYIPGPDAGEVNSLFFPPAQYDPDYGVYVVDCDALAPAFGVTISGETFVINPLDLIFPAGDDLCLSGIQNGTALEGSDGPFILGDVFLKNVLAVFDLTPGDYQMHFSPRVYYES